jgi:adenylyl-sulfate kinase
MQKGVTVWLTGLSGAGKTTISRLAAQKLRSYGCRTAILDGDAVRARLCADLGFSEADRWENIRRVSRVAKHLAGNGFIVLASFISPYRAMREFCRAELDPFIEVYVRCSLEECMRRDVKGLYRRAADGEIRQFTGLDAPFEEPDHPELILDTEKESPQMSTAKLFSYLWHAGHVKLKSISSEAAPVPGSRIRNRWRTD